MVNLEGEGSFGFVWGERDEVRGVTMETIRVDAVGIVMGREEGRYRSRVSLV